MSVARQWVARDRALRAVPARASPPRRRPARRRGADRRRARERRRRHLVRHRHARHRRRSRPSRWDRLLLDEAQDVKNPATKRARALRRLDARRRARDDRHADREPARRALGDHGHRQPRAARLARVVPAQLRAADRGERRRGARSSGCARWCSRSSCAGRRTAPRSSSSCRRSRSTKDYCRLTLEQASLYQATVDRWMPRIEEHERSFGRRGAVLAMLGQLKQVCNHPEMVLATGRPLDGRSGKLERLVELLEAMPARRQGARLHAVPGLRPARAAPAASASAARSASSTAA